MREPIRAILLVTILTLLFAACNEDSGSGMPDQDAATDSLSVIDSTSSLQDSVASQPPPLPVPDFRYPEKEPLQPGTDFDFIEGLYCTAWTIRSSRFSAILDSAAAAGINTIIFDIKNMEGHLFINPPQVPGLLDHRIPATVPIQNTVNRIHERGMRAVARMVCFHDQHLARKDSTLTPQKKDGSRWIENPRKDYCWLDSSNPRVQRDLLEIVKYITTLGIDELQLDYIRFPTQGDQKDLSFHFQREDSLLIAEAIARGDTLDLPVRRTRADIVAGFVEKVKRVCEARNVALTADVFAIIAWQRNVDIRSTGQRLERMTRHLDKLHPMIYSSHFDGNFGHRSAVNNEPYQILYKGTVKSQQHSKCPVVPYIQANDWNVRYTYPYVAAQLAAIDHSGARGYLLWNSGSQYNTTLRWIRIYKRENPQFGSND